MGAGEQLTISNVELRIVDVTTRDRWHSEPPMHADGAGKPRVMSECGLRIADLGSHTNKQGLGSNK